jgi:dTDP-4-dehydrorhamnose 3,5-epimerase
VLQIGTKEVARANGDASAPSAIDGVRIIQLRQFPDERGKVMHMLRKTDPHFLEFGEVYFSVVMPGAIKAWHLHRRMVLNYAVPIGRIKLVVYDCRPASPTHGVLQEIFVGEDHYSLVTVPAGVWNGFKGYGTTQAIVCNCATHVYDPEDIVRLDPFDPRIPYDWSLKHR